MEHCYCRRFLKCMHILKMYAYINGMQVLLIYNKGRVPLPDTIYYQTKSPAGTSYLFSSSYCMDFHSNPPNTLQNIVAWGYPLQLVGNTFITESQWRIQYDHWPESLILTGYFLHSERFYASYLERKVINSFTQLWMLQAIIESGLARYIPLVQE